MHSNEPNYEKQIHLTAYTCPSQPRLWRVLHQVKEINPRKDNVQSLVQKAAVPKPSTRKKI